MRQLQVLLRRIQTRNTTKDYNYAALHAKLAGAEIPSLEEILGVPSEDTGGFDDDTDAAFEKHALALLEKNKAAKRE